MAVGLVQLATLMELRANLAKARREELRTPIPSKVRACTYECVQWRSELVPATIKRHPAQIRYNLLLLPFTSWI